MVHEARGFDPASRTKRIEGERGIVGAALGELDQRRRLVARARPLLLDLEAQAQRSAREQCAELFLASRAIDSVGQRDHAQAATPDSADFEGRNTEVRVRQKIVEARGQWCKEPGGWNPDRRKQQVLVPGFGIEQLG